MSAALVRILCEIPLLPLLPGPPFHSITHHRVTRISAAPGPVIPHTTDETTYQYILWWLRLGKTLQIALELGSGKFF